MLAVRFNRDQFAYDIYSLVKAFYPAEEVKLFVDGEKDLSSDRNLPEFFVRFADEKKEDRICSKMIFEIYEEGKLKRRAVSEADEELDRREYKNTLKQLLYKELSRYTGKTLPWGNLTGIRPTKIPYELLGQGKTKEECADFMIQKYSCSEKKAVLATEIAEREHNILSRLHAENGYSLYIGIPFCPTTCLYCSFTSFPIGLWKKKVADYLTAVEKEIDYVAEDFRDKVLDSIYIGGGTPTTLEPEELDRLLSCIEKKLDLSHLLEFTVEAGRPDSITEAKLQVLHAHGITRISINPQTFKEETLRLIGRRHTVQQVRDAYALARKTGFSNINMDLILGLPNETEEDVKETLRQAKELNPDSLTVHSLAIKRASRMSQWIAENGIQCLNNTDAAMQDAMEATEEMRMKPYYLYRQKNMSGNFENVGYAKEGKYGIYNILIMEEIQNIVALGAGTVSKRVYGNGKIERCDTPKDVDLYISRIDEMVERKRNMYSK